MSAQKRKKLALVTTIWGWRNHANHMGERFLNGYPLNGKWHRPEMDVAGAYVHQRPADTDLSGLKAERFDFEIYPTIAETLRLGTDKIAVEAVLLIGEHGDYPDNEKGQKLYPRRRLFEEIVKVFRRAGRSVSLFNDKHFSYSWSDAEWMYGQSKELGFPLMAGSSVPVA